MAYSYTTLIKLVVCNYIFEANIIVTILVQYMYDNYDFYIYLIEKKIAKLSLKFCRKNPLHLYDFLLFETKIVHKCMHIVSVSYHFNTRFIFSKDRWNKHYFLRRRNYSMLFYGGYYYVTLIFISLEEIYPMLHNKYKTVKY